MYDINALQNVMQHIIDNLSAILHQLNQFIESSSLTTCEASMSPVVQLSRIDELSLFDIR